VVGLSAAEEQLEDHVWVAEAGSRGWIVLTADKRLRYTVSSQLLVAHRVAIFQLARGNLTGPAQVRWCLANLAAICLACDGPRPFIYNVHERRIVRIWP
jgi:hypothetical protein